MACESILDACEAVLIRPEDTACDDSMAGERVAWTIELGKEGLSYKFEDGMVCRDGILEGGVDCQEGAPCGMVCRDGVLEGGVDCQ